MILILTDDGLILLPIVFNMRFVLSVADWNTVYTIQRKNTLCGIVSQRHLKELDTRLPAYVCMSA